MGNLSKNVEVLSIKQGDADLFSEDRCDNWKLCF